MLSGQSDILCRAELFYLSCHFHLVGSILQKKKAYILLSMDFALLNVNDKNLSKSTPNLAARRASDVGQGAVLVTDGQEKELKDVVHSFKSP